MVASVRTPSAHMNVSRGDADLHVADLGAEDVVAGIGDVRVAGETGEQNHAIGLRVRSDAKHRGAARGTEYDLHPLNVGQLVVGG